MISGWVTICVLDILLAISGCTQYREESSNEELVEIPANTMA